MSISVTCECGRSFEAPEMDAGRLAWCPDCGRGRVVPKPTMPPELEFFAPGAESPVNSGKAIASLVLGLLFVFACLTGVPAILLDVRALCDIRRSGGRLKGRGLAVAGIVLGVIGCLVTLLPQESREAPRRAHCVNNLKQIGLALHNYHEANGCLPPAAVTGKDGKPLLSWRVLILLYTESGTLYAEFHLDEPWDSPHNLPLLSQMPNVYACPSDQTRKPGTTGYQAVIGPATAFTPDFKPLTIQDFTDGTDRTLLVGETRRAVPWTKPEDLPFNMSVPLSGLGGHHGYRTSGFNALFADGHVRFLKSTIAPSVLGALLTRNGDEVVSPDSY